MKLHLDCFLVARQKLTLQRWQAVLSQEESPFFVRFDPDNLQPFHEDGNQRCRMHVGFTSSILHRHKRPW